MSLLKSAAEIVKQENRRIIVMGAKGTGKTTFSVSASKEAGNSIVGGPRACSDVLVLQGDSGGITGAVDAGLTPVYNIDMTEAQTWHEYEKKIVAALPEIRTLVVAGTIKVIVIDLAYPARLIEEHVKPTTIADWSKIKVLGGSLYRALSGLRGVTVVANCQIKSAVQAIPSDATKSASEARSMGGELSRYTMSLSNGIAELWRDNASFVFTREAKRAKMGPDGKESEPAEYWTYTQASAKYQAASRAKSVLPARIKGDTSLRYILQRVYGENI